jgi:hypothetical protein
MVANIAIMIGAYIVVRMTQLLSRKNEGYYAGGIILSKVFAVVALIVTVICVIDVLFTSASPLVP